VSILIAARGAGRPVARLAAGLEGLDDEHAAAAAAQDWASGWAAAGRSQPPLRS